MSMRFIASVYLCLLTLVVSAQQNNFSYQITKHLKPSKCAVVSAHPLASEAGVTVMRQGGNAFDAAIATQLALAVVYPAAGNLGGGGFLVSYGKGGAFVIDYREMAPGHAHRDMYLDPDGKANTQKSQEGHLAAGVPGTVAGLFATHAKAKLPFSKLIAPAIDLAERGFVITGREARDLNRNRDNFLRLNTRPTAFTKETPWKAGDTLVQKDLAETLKRISRNGAKGFYEGKTADLVVAEMQRGGGMISKADLKNYKARVRDRFETRFLDHTVLSMPPPSSGGIGLAQMLGMVEHFPMKQWGFHSAESVQLMIEAERRAYADRAKYLGDPDFYKVPVAALINPAYLVQRIKDFTPGKPTPSERIEAGELAGHMETTHLSVLDAEGNAVAVTTTLNGGYGCKVAVGGAGFLLNNEMDDFSISPGTPNMFGLIGGEANAVAPGKRMLSSMTPTIVLKDGKPLLITGTPGGSTIITSMFQTLVNDLVFGLDPVTNVNAPKFHHQWKPEDVKIEADFPKETRRKLEAMGYKLTETGSWSRTELIKVYPDGRIEAVADKRGDDSAAGF